MFLRNISWVDKAKYDIPKRSIGTPRAMTRRIIMILKKAAWSFSKCQKNIDNGETYYRIVY